VDDVVALLAQARKLSSTDSEPARAAGARK
jgi:hypothetical protein